MSMGVKHGSLNSGDLISEYLRLFKIVGAVLGQTPVKLG